MSRQQLKNLYPEKSKSQPDIKPSIIFQADQMKLQHDNNHMNKINIFERTANFGQKFINYAPPKLIAKKKRKQMISIPKIYIETDQFTSKNTARSQHNTYSYNNHQPQANCQTTRAQMQSFNDFTHQQISKNSEKDKPLILDLVRARSKASIESSFHFQQKKTQKYTRIFSLINKIGQSESEKVFSSDQKYIDTSVQPISQINDFGHKLLKIQQKQPKEFGLIEPEPNLQFFENQSTQGNSLANKIHRTSTHQNNMRTLLLTKQTFSDIVKPSLPLSLKSSRKIFTQDCSEQSKPKTTFLLKLQSNVIKKLFDQ